MHTGHLLELTSDLVDAIAEATDHAPCESSHCVFCGEVTGRDVYTLLQGIERAIGDYVLEPGARESAAAATVDGLLDRLRATPTLVPRPPGTPRVHDLWVLRDFDERAALRLFAYLKGISLDLHHGSGWPRIET